MDGLAIDAGGGVVVEPDVDERVLIVSLEQVGELLLDVLELGVVGA